MATVVGIATAATIDSGGRQRFQGEALNNTATTGQAANHCAGARQKCPPCPVAYGNGHTMPVLLAARRACRAKLALLLLRLFVFLGILLLEVLKQVAKRA